MSLNQNQSYHNGQWKERKYLQEPMRTQNHLKRGKTRAPKSCLFSVLHLIGWKCGTSFLNQSHSKVKQNESSPGLLLALNWKLPLVQWWKYEIHKRRLHILKSLYMFVYTDNQGKVQRDLHNMDLEFIKFKYFYNDDEECKYRSQYNHRVLYDLGRHFSNSDVSRCSLKHIRAKFSSACR